MTTRLILPLERPPDADVVLPGSKSITNRALVASSLASGRSRLDGLLLADDTEAMINGLRTLGATIDVDRPQGTAHGAVARAHIDGCGGVVPARTGRLDAHLSGTTARFLAPVAALGSGTYELTAAPSMRARPMGPTLDALRDLGVAVTELATPGHLPVTIASDGLAGGSVEVSGDVSSQFLSGLLLAAPAAERAMTVRVTSRLVSGAYVELTLATMAAFGVDVARPDATTFAVPDGGYHGAQLAVEPDATAASYFLAAAAICGGRVRVPGLDRGAWQGDVAFADVLARMGADVRWEAGAVEVRGTGTLRGVEVDMGAISDTAQTLAAVAVFADGPTRVTGIGFIRTKETDRVAAVVRELRRCGIGAREEDDGFVVEPGSPGPARVRTYDDHRMAMSFALLGLRAPGIEISDPGCVSKTFPDYFEVLDALR